MPEKNYPSTFAELEDHFNTLDESNEDTFGDQSEWNNNPCEGCQQIEYPLPDEEAFYGDDRFTVLKYKESYYQPAFETTHNCIKGFIEKKLFEEWRGDLDPEEGGIGSWVIVDTDFLEEDEDGEYPFQVPTFYELVKNGKKLEKKKVPLGELEAEDFKVIAEALYGLDPELMQEEGFSIAPLTFIELKEKGVENPAEAAQDLLNQIITEIEEEEEE